MRIAPRHRLPLAILASAAVVAVVLAALVVGGSAEPTETAPPGTSPASSTDPFATPEGAVRAFFVAFAAARRTDDPLLVEAYVTGRTSSAYRSVAAFLQGQKESGKASVTTVQRIENVVVQASDAIATVTFDYTEGGYDIDPASGSPLESPTILPPTRVVAEVHRIDGRWLVDSYEQGQ